MSVSPLPPRPGSEMSRISGLEELMQTEYFSQNLARLNPDLKAVVLEALDELFQQETFATIDMIQECRAELQGEARLFDQEVEQLRAESRMLAEERENRIARRSKSRNSCSTSRSDSRMTDSRMSFVGDQAASGLPLSEYIAKRRSGDLPPPGSSPLMSRSSLSRVSTSTPSLSIVSEQTMQKESEQILRSMSKADARREEQRERQQERLQQQRDERRRAQQARVGKAVELLEKALALDKLMERDKASHGQKIQDRLEEMKKKREGRASEMDRMTPTLPNVAEEQENTDPYANMEKY